MGPVLRRASSRLLGWISDVTVPRPLRAPIYRAYARAFDVDLGEVRLELAEHPSLGAFFVRRLKDGARPFPADPAVLPAPCDSTVQSVDPIEHGSILQAKGRAYPVAELLGPLAERFPLEGGHAWTLYLSPRDYHRVHAPDSCVLAEVAWIPGERHSVAPRVLAREPRVLSINERAVLLLDTASGPLALVMVGALNVGRIRVLGVEPGVQGPPATPRAFARGDELARFEMGSTVVLLAPPDGPGPVEGLAPGRRLRMGEPIGRR